jgi:hypothetical protein
LRKYRPIWNEIKATQKAEVTVSKHLVATLIQGVKKIKSEENSTRSLMGLVPFSKLVISQEEISKERQIVKVTFKLLYNTYL